MITETAPETAEPAPLAEIRLELKIGEREFGNIIRFEDRQHLTYKKLLEVFKLAGQSIYMALKSEGVIIDDTAESVSLAN